MGGRTLFLVAAACVASVACGRAPLPPRALVADAANVADVRAFGARGDGASDDTQAFVRAIDTGHPVRVPAGVYRLNSLRVGRAHVAIEGEGTRSILRAASADAPLFEVEADDFSLSDVALEGAALDESTEAWAIHTRVEAPARRGALTRVALTSNGTRGFNDGIKLDTGSDDWSLRDSRVEGLIGATSGHGYGVLTGAAARTSVLRSTFVATSRGGRHGVYLSGGARDGRVEGCSFEGFAEASIALFSRAHQPPTERNVILDNRVVAAGIGATDSGAIELAGRVRDNRVEHNVVDGAGRFGIVITAARAGSFAERNLVRDNLVRGAGAAGIYVLGGVANTVVANRIVDANRAPPFAVFAAILIDDQDDLVAVDNRVEGNVISTTSTPTYRQAITNASSRPLSNLVRANTSMPGVLERAAGE
jgi:hypothetical protein